MSKKKSGLLIAFGAMLGGAVAAGISYYLKLKSFNDELDQDFHEYEEEDSPSDENEEPETEDEEEYSDNEYADEFLSLEDLLVCVVTENLYILIWEKPYYILDRHGFEDEKDGEFRQFIEEKARIIEA